ncbi:MAG: hypothetical protein M1831_002697 [Alyxoria varia]|nr:MAG: hypothetical protein M1831_002697 [Alyxoria varia]
MASTEPSGGAQKRPRVRKSMGNLPSPNVATNASNRDNKTLDQAASSTASSTTNTTKVTGKKTRSKSLGPGGLDALKETSGNSTKRAPSAPPKSILKPSIPLSPLKEIPTRRQADDLSNANPTKKVPNHPEGGNGQFDVETSPNESVEGSSQVTAHTTVRTKSNVQDIAEQTAIETNAEAEARNKRKAEVQKQRDERRKSMAKRRVSFAPEATLHTFDIEYMMDSTASSSSPNPTGRASALSQSQNGDSANRPTTPPEQIEEKVIQSSPEHQRDVHQKKRRRRSSGIPPMNFNDPESLSSSPYSSASGLDDDGDDTGTAVQGPAEAESVASDSEDGATDYPTAKNTGLEAVQNDAKAGGDEDLDNSLSEAADRAGTRKLEVDEVGDVSMEIAGDDVTAAFRPWVQQSVGVGSPHPRASPKFTNKENKPIVMPKSASEPQAATEGSVDDEDMSMDMTRPMGGIVQDKKDIINRRKSLGNRRQSIANGETGEGTMEFTTAIGGIQPDQAQEFDEMSYDENEELSMEFTNVVGGLQFGGQLNAHTSQFQAENQGSPVPRTHTTNDHTNSSNGAADDGEGTMEMTAAVGSIMQPGAQNSIPVHEDHGEMDFTKAVGGILGDRTAGQEQQGTLTATSPMRRGNTSAKPRPSLTTSAQGSPRFSGARPRGRPRKSDVSQVLATPEKSPTTPAKQVTPPAPKPATPAKAPPSANVAMRTPSPKMLFKNELKAAQSPLAQSPKLFQAGAQGGQRTPTLVLEQPKQGNSRRASGFGIDKDGLGSPRMAEILDRRSSIGDKADIFAPKEGASRGVRFENPREMEADISKEREEDQRRESGQFIMEQEADAEEDDRDATTSLREMIDSMTPKKDSTKGRKSLAVGSAKGLLGKRPTELDESEDEPSPRTFGKQSSPVKRVRLEARSTNAEQSTVKNKPPRKSLAEVSGSDRPITPNVDGTPSGNVASTPTSQSRFKNAESITSTPKTVPDEAEEKIGLQDFLNLTNVRFMELTTTKRRATVALAVQEGDESGKNYEDSESPEKLLENSFVAGACTIPMLELFQHSCRELKKYIGEGRNVIREIEVETVDENPPIFREYTSASPRDRAFMDTQFRNMKSNARLLSKATWYEWRMKLLEGLQESLAETVTGMQQDDASLAEQEKLLDPLLPRAQEEYAKLQRQYEELHARAEELASCDPEDLVNTRKRAKFLGEEIAQRNSKIEEQQRVLGEMDEAVASGREAKDECYAATKEAQKVREECRGLSAAEVSNLKARVNALETSTGWTVTSAAGTTLTLTYSNQLQLYFDTAKFLPLCNSPPSGGAPESFPTASSISLSYIGADLPMDGMPKHRHPGPLTTTKRFFLQLLRALLLSLGSSGAGHQVQAADLLRLVKEGWKCALRVEEEVSKLEMRVGATDASILGDERLGVESTVLLPKVETKVAVGFECTVSVDLSHCMNGEGGDRSQGPLVDLGVAPRAKVVYGQEYREDRMGDFLRTRVDERMSACGGANAGKWADAVVELRSRLIARGRKG